jgi:hypothetical protein
MNYKMNINNPFNNVEMVGIGRYRGGVSLNYKVSQC